MTKQPPLSIHLPPRQDSQTVTQWAYQSLRNALMVGQIPPGRALTIRGLADLLGVSPMPVREALRQLAAENALEILGNRRVMVPQMTAMKFTELCEARIALESHAAVRALPYVDKERLEQLRQLDLEIDRAQESGKLEQINRLNQHFHRLLYRANPHQVTLPLIESLWLQLGPFVRLATQQLQDHYQIDRHKEAINALERQDSLALQLAIGSDIRDGLAFAGTPEMLSRFLNGNNQHAQ
ncbi:GntR family transcriptional regulator [Motiliproteus coralliicola]|uniref:GntR family transcriptional regulator n=1 Tax=Motiliproteus coralliicola TaxID=2283196 RepID=A0A369WH24_9GAMM|nr:GntR family transcriptional regulator [Motiliproteus coralliicola]RDE19916.1 GntR family transcriptional regulator [Motiliproteus coralliicola]